MASNSSSFLAFPACRNGNVRSDLLHHDRIDGQPEQHPAGGSGNLPENAFGLTFSPTKIVSWWGLSWLLTVGTAAPDLPGDPGASGEIFNGCA
jgi:hypothetical protein